MTTKTDNPVNANAISRISAGTVIKGEITSPNDIRIDGEFEGKIISGGRVVIGETAVIKGDLVCGNVDMWGKIEGNVYVKEILSLKSGCSIKGNIQTSRLYVEIGAEFNGNCKMISEQEFAKLSGAPAPASKKEESAK